MADSTSPPNDPEEQRGDASGDPTEVPSEEEDRRQRAPGYDTNKEDYAGISAGALHSLRGLHDARDFAEMIVDTIREGLLVLDFDLRVQAANESFYHTFGVRPEESVGRLVYDLGDGQWDLPELRELLEGILPHERAFNDYEVEHAFEGLGRRVMLLNARRLDDHQLILLAIEDVTERMERERELRESEERFRLLVENAREYAIFSVDKGNRITMWSPGAERILGWSRKEAIGQSGAIIFTEEDRAAGAPERELERARTMGNALDERWHVRKDGSRFWASGVMVALEAPADGESLRGYAKILRDNTERKEQEEALRRMNASLEGRVEERTAQVRGLARALTLAEHEERRRIAHVLHDNLQQVLFGARLSLSTGDTVGLGSILDEALELTRTLSHELSPPFLEGEDVEDLLRWLAERKRERYGLEVAVEIRGDMPVPEAALRVLLYQLVRELLLNVAKHAGTSRVRLVAERVDGHVRVVVVDEGTGFDPAGLERSHGLGLSSVRERVELVGGSFEVASAPGKGTRVSITLPVAGKAAEQA